jgi:hypothetical protein
MPNSPPADKEVAERWQTVRSALDSWSQTVRLCLIYLASGASAGIVAWLIRH